MIGVVPDVYVVEDIHDRLSEDKLKIIVELCRFYQGDDIWMKRQAYHLMNRASFALDNEYRPIKRFSENDKYFLRHIYSEDMYQPEKNLIENYIFGEVENDK